MRGEGYTRDISSGGIFVVTRDRLPSGTAVEMEVTLPSLTENRSGVFLRTLGRVVRLDETGFAAAADIEFRVQFAGGFSSASAVGARGGNGKCKAGSRRNQAMQMRLVPRFWM